MDKKKILVFIGASYVSGLEIVTLHLIKELREKGNEVRCVVSGWNDGLFVNKLKELDIPFEQVKIGWVYFSKPLWTLDTLMHLPGAYQSCKKILKEFNPDICHFCGYGMVIMLSPLLKNRSCVYNLQEPHAPTKKHLFIYRLLNRRIGIFTTVSKYIVKVLLDLQIPPHKIRLIYNGVPVLKDIFPAQVQKQPLVFGIIGQIVPWKGHETLIDAMELLSKQYHLECKVYVFGNDKTEYAQHIKEKIARKNLSTSFEWKGFIKEQDAIYDQVDVVVVPSLSQEPCSLTILESMMRAKVIIASGRGGNPELITDGKDGFIFEAGNAASLAACAAKIISDRDLFTQTGLNARKKALANFTSTGMEEAYDKVYTEIA